MDLWMTDLWMAVLSTINDLLWHDNVLFAVVGAGVLFTVWSGFSQYRALTHGVAVIAGRYDKRDDPGAINHFQALSAALSATVGLGNIAGVAIAISIGGPGAVFWMWLIGFVGMALKLTEVSQAMLYRNLDDPQNPSGGAMWIASKGFARWGPRWAVVGKAIAGVFCVTLLIATFTGGNMFQAWNVADVTREYFGVPIVVTGVVQMVLVGLVVIGGIHRIGAVAGRLVPFMCGLYLVAGLAVIAARFELVPEMLRLIFHHAFNPTQAQGAFVGGAAGWAFLRGMQRALFSNEVGQGSAPIAHAAAKTDEPVREGIVAGLEPFIDTLVVCTITALVILLSGVWSRAPEAPYDPARLPAFTEVAPGEWTLVDAEPPPRRDKAWAAGDQLFTVVAAAADPRRGSDHHRLYGAIEDVDGRPRIVWERLASDTPPRLAVPGVYAELKGATLTAKAFDAVFPGLGRWLIPAVAWLFALSTMISWSYYGEQGAVYLFGRRSVTAYRLLYCLLILAASTPLIRTEAELDVISNLGTGVMLVANIPIMLIFGREAMREYHRYVRRLKAGEFERSRRP